MVQSRALNKRAWDVVKLPADSAKSYHRALKKAQAACDLTSNNGYYLNTLGVAPYRVGSYQKALDTLERSDKINSSGVPSIREPSLKAASTGVVALASSLD